jgi:hypothetical protein
MKIYLDSSEKSVKSILSNTIYSDLGSEIASSRIKVDKNMEKSIILYLNL